MVNLCEDEGGLQEADMGGWCCSGTTSHCGRKNQKITTLFLPISLKVLLQPLRKAKRTYLP